MLQRTGECQVKPCHVIYQLRQFYRVHIGKEKTQIATKSIKKCYPFWLACDSKQF